jgi:hypothetical protein
MPSGTLRTVLAEILYEELGNGDLSFEHPRLYDDFLESIGVPKSALNDADIACVQYLKNVQKSLIKESWSYGVGLRGMGGECLCQVYLATMHEYFSTNPVIVEIQDKIAWKFWDIHIGEVDLHHQEIVRSAINECMIAHPEIITDLTNGYVQSLQAWDDYWGEIFKNAKKTG